MKRKVELTYEIYGSASAGEKGYWRWVITSPHGKKILQVGSFYGPLSEAKRHAEAVVKRLQAGIWENPRAIFSRPRSDITSARD